MMMSEFKNSMAKRKQDNMTDAEVAEFREACRKIFEDDVEEAGLVEIIHADAVLVAARAKRNNDL